MATEPQDVIAAADLEVSEAEVPVSPAVVAPDAEAPTEDEAHRKFREALERKNHQHHASHESGGGRSGVGPSNNSKTTRQFRRKSGG
jgi:hypothetical protein